MSILIRMSIILIEVYNPSGLYIYANKVNKKVYLNKNDMLPPHDRIILGISLFFLVIFPKFQRYFQMEKQFLYNQKKINKMFQENPSTKLWDYI